MRELVVISGKGGTGKTSITASFAALAKCAVIADCDVDAPDLHLILSPTIMESYDFYSGHEAIIDQEKCTRCGLCFDHCRFEAVTKASLGNNLPHFEIESLACEGCGVCVRFCPENAMRFPERHCGQWMVSQMRFGPMVHARLNPAAENSGKLVSTVRREAHRISDEQNLPVVIVDGPPGIGCPVIASLTGATRVLVVAEPTVSGEHALKRILVLAKHFNLPASVCVNKYDLNLPMTRTMEKEARKSGADVLGRIRYDRAVTLAQMQNKAVVETDARSAEDIRIIWGRLSL